MTPDEKKEKLMELLGDPPPFPPRGLFRYQWLYLAMGTGNGMIWTVTFEELMQPRTAHIVIWSVAAGMFVLQGINLFIENRRMKRWEGDVKKWLMNHNIKFPKPEE